VQLVELQDAWPELDREGIALFGLSYDAVETLAAFADKRGITFPLLSDEGSRTIRRLGLLNAHVAEQHAFYGVALRDDHQGIPYPGIFVLDEHGVVVDKHFEQSYRVRPTAALVREYALGRVAAAPPDAAARSAQGVRVRAWTDAPTYRPYQQVRLHVQLELAPGAHVFAQPTPDDYLPLRLEIESLDGLTVGPPELPAAKPFSISGLDEELVVYEGRVEAMLPLLFTKNLGATRVALQVAYQACTETTCWPPAEMRLDLMLEGLDLIRD
jgi:peroxiredoxin